MIWIMWRQKNYVIKKGTVELEEYRKLKEELASKYSDDRKMYTAIKNEFIQNIISLYKKIIQNNIVNT